MGLRDMAKTYKYQFKVNINVRRILTVLVAQVFVSFICELQKSLTVMNHIFFKKKE